MLLQVEHFTKSFGGLVAVDNVSFSVREGEIFGLIGPNGAGKTTLLNLIAGSLQPDTGKVTFDGSPITAYPPHRVCAKGIGRTFQISRPFLTMTALENVMVAAAFGSPEPVEDQEVYSKELLESVGFPAATDTVAEDLNTVQLKRLDLARALATRPRLLLLDEIGAGLTPTELNELMSLVRSIRDQGITIIAVEHLLKMIMEISDTIMVLQKGSKIAEDIPEEIARNREVIDVYLGEKYLPEARA
jgi:branched-chain amino acid transport system ATP-binding protein